MRKIILELEDSGWYCGVAMRYDGSTFPVFSENKENTSHYIFLIDENDALLERVDEVGSANFIKTVIDVESKDISKDMFLSVDKFHKYGITKYVDNLLKNIPVHGNA